MTNREFFTAVVNADVSEEIKAFALDSIAKLDHKNDLRKSKPSKTAIANEPIKENIVKFLNGTQSALASEIASACEISTSKASALARQLVENGIVNVCDVKVKGKGTMKSYSLNK